MALAFIFETLNTKLIRVLSKLCVQLVIACINAKILVEFTTVTSKQIYKHKKEKKYQVNN